MQAVRLSCKKSAELRKIIAALKDAGGEHTPAAIASLTGLKPVNVRNLLRKMVACGDVSQPRVRLLLGSIRVSCLMDAGYSGYAL